MTSRNDNAVTVPKPKPVVSSFPLLESIYHSTLMEHYSPQFNTTKTKKDLQKELDDARKLIAEQQEGECMFTKMTQRSIDLNLPHIL